MTFLPRCKLRPAEEAEDRPQGQRTGAGDHLGSLVCPEHFPERVQTGWYDDTIRRHRRSRRRGALETGIGHGSSYSGLRRVGNRSSGRSGRHGRDSQSQAGGRVSNTEGLGVLGAATSGPDELRAWIREIRSLTDRPFGVDTLLPASVRRMKPTNGPSPMDEQPAQQAFLKEFLDREGLEEHAPWIELASKGWIEPLASDRGLRCMDAPRSPARSPGRRALVVDHVSPGREVPVLRALGLRIHVLRAARSCRSADRAAKRLASGSCLLISSSIQSRALAQTSGSSNHSIATFGLPIAPAKSCRCWLVRSETASLRFRSNSSKIIPKISTPLCTRARAFCARRVL